MSAAQQLAFQPFLTARCPFCGGQFSAGELATGMPAVLHTLPICAPYEHLAITDFLAAVREVHSTGLTRAGEQGGKSS